MLIEKYLYLKGVNVYDDDIKVFFLVYVVFGSGEYVRIKMEIKLRIG